MVCLFSIEVIDWRELLTGAAVVTYSCVFSRSSNLTASDSKDSSMDRTKNYLRMEMLFLLFFPLCAASNSKFIFRPRGSEYQAVNPKPGGKKHPQICETSSLSVILTVS